MKKLLTLSIFIILSFSSSNAKINESDKEKLIKCLGLYAANSFLTQDKLSLAKIEHSLGGKKFLTMYLLENGMSEDEVNKKIEIFREKGSIGSSLDSEVHISCNENDFFKFSKYGDELKFLFLVSKVR